MLLVMQNIAKVIFNMNSLFYYFTSLTELKFRRHSHGKVFLHKY